MVFTCCLNVVTCNLGEVKDEKMLASGPHY